MELYAIVEQLLKDIFEKIQSKPFVKQKDTNVINDLESSLKSFLTINNKGSLKNLAMLRNYIIHNTFSMKKARKDEANSEKYIKNSKKKIPEKSKDLYSALHENVVGYIKGISYKESKSGS